MDTKYKVISIKKTVYDDDITLEYTLVDTNNGLEFTCYIKDDLLGNHIRIGWLDDEGNIFDLVEALVLYDASIYDLLDGEVISPALEKLHSGSKIKSNYRSLEEYKKFYDEEENRLVKRFKYEN